MVLEFVVVVVYIQRIIKLFRGPEIQQKFILFNMLKIPNHDIRSLYFILAPMVYEKEIGKMISNFGDRIYRIAISYLGLDLVRKSSCKCHL